MLGPLIYELAYLGFPRTTSTRDTCQEMPHRIPCMPPPEDDDAFRRNDSCHRPLMSMSHPFSADLLSPRALVSMPPTSRSLVLMSSLFLVIPCSESARGIRALGQQNPTP